MANDNVVNIFCEERMNRAVDQIVINDPIYKKASLHSSKAIDKLIKTGLTKKQYKLLDKADCAKNLLAVEYGRIAYIQGMKDGLQYIPAIEWKPGVRYLKLNIEWKGSIFRHSGEKKTPGTNGTPLPCETKTS